MYNFCTLFYLFQNFVAIRTDLSSCLQNDAACFLFLFGHITFLLLKHAFVMFVVFVVMIFFLQINILISYTVSVILVTLEFHVHVQ